MKIQIYSHKTPEDVSASVDECKVVAHPFRFAIEPIPGDPFLGIYNGLFLFQHPVEECGFAYIGAADDGDDWICHG